MTAKKNLIMLSLAFLVVIDNRSFSIAEDSEILSPFGTFCNQGRFDLLDELGGRWIRYPIHWQWVEPKRDQFPWKAIDRKFSLVPSSIQVIAGFETRQLKWATQVAEGGGQGKHESSYPPKDMQEYYDFVYAFTKHFRGKIEHFNIENEASVPYFWQGTVEEFLDLRRVAYQAIHDANPRALVIDTGFAGPCWGMMVARDLYESGYVKEAIEFGNGYIRNNNQKRARSEAELREGLYSEQAQRTYHFLKKAFADGSSFDVAAIHFYAPSEYLEAVIDWVKKEMRKNGYEKPIWITEMGVKDTFEIISPIEAANELVKKHVLALAKGIQVIVWFRLIATCCPNPMSAPDEPLYDAEGKMLPAGAAYQVLVNQVQGFTHVAQQETSNSMRIFRFDFDSNGSDPVFVLWSEQPQTANLKTSADQIRMIDILGNQSVLKPQKGILSLEVTEQPVWMQGELRL